jgi:uncharacterized membrane protein YkoI
MSRRLKAGLIATAVIAAAAGGGAAIAAATGGDDDARDKPITGTALERASKAALEHTGGGRVTATEIGDEEGYYEIEVRRDDGSQVDVHLDRDLTLLDASPDGDASHGDGASED